MQAIESSERSRPLDGNLVHIVEQGLVGLVLVHQLKHEVHRFRGVHVREKLAQDPYPVGGAPVEQKVVAAIKRELKPDFVAVERDITILMVVGEGMCYTPGMLAKACLALASAGISMSMVNQGSSEVSFMIAIRSQDRDAAVRALYKAFFG